MVKLWTRDEYHAIKWHWERYWKDDCPLCDIINLNKENLVWKWKHWFIVHNIYPYSGTEEHLMAVPITHKIFFTELNENEILELKDIHLFMKDYFTWKEYFSCNRESLANRSIEHLHIHFIPWKLQWKYLRKMLMDQGFPIIEHID